MLAIEALPVGNGAMEAKKSVCRFCVKETRLDKFIVIINQFLSPSITYTQWTDVQSKLAMDFTL